MPKTNVIAAGDIAAGAFALVPAMRLARRSDPGLRRVRAQSREEPLVEVLKKVSVDGGGMHWREDMRARGNNHPHRTGTPQRSINAPSSGAGGGGRGASSCSPSIVARFLERPHAHVALGPNYSS